MRHVLSTDHIQSSKRLSYWNDVICETYVKLDCDAPSDHNFRGDITSYDFPDLSFSIVNSTDQTVNRTKTAISNDSDNWFITSFQTKGQGKIRQNDREAYLSAGDFAIYDSSRPYTLEMQGEFEQIVLKLPTSALTSKLKGIEDLTAQAVSSKKGAGHVLINMLQALKDEAGNLDQTCAAAISSGIVSVLTGGLQSLVKTDISEQSNLSNYHIQRIKNVIHQQLHNPKLNIESLSELVGLSNSHIHRLFQSQPESASQYLWRCRLDACQRDIINPFNKHTSLAEIAFRWGFNDAAHFSRLYRSNFGCTPSQQRQRSLK